MQKFCFQGNFNQNYDSERDRKEKRNKGTDFPKKLA